MLLTASRPGLVPLGQEEVHGLREQFSNDADVKGFIAASKKIREGISEIAQGKLMQAQGQMMQAQGQDMQAQGRTLKASAELGLQETLNDKKLRTVQAFCSIFGIKQAVVEKMQVEKINSLYSKYAEKSIIFEGDRFKLISMKEVVDYIDENKTQVSILDFRYFKAGIDGVPSLSSYLSGSSCAIKGIFIDRINEKYLTEFAASKGIRQLKTF